MPMEKFPMGEHQPLPESQWDAMAGFANWRTEELEREAQKEHERRERWRAELREKGLID
ncbi:MAG TPA: hypothetical protein VIL13_08780 [Longimicrobiales bacterium]|jgi:heme-degrading monooxygenase HmoA